MARWARLRHPYAFVSGGDDPRLVTPPRNPLMKSRIVVYKPLPEDVLAWLREQADVIEVDASKHDAFVAALKDADGAIGSTVQITPAMIDGASRLKALST